MICCFLFSGDLCKITEESIGNNQTRFFLSVRKSNKSISSSEHFNW